MKISVEYSESIEVAPGLWRKIGIVLEDSDSHDREIALPKETAQVLHNQAKEYVQKWHQEGGVGIGQLAGLAEPKVIDRTKTPGVKIEDEIMSCQSIKVLESYKLIVKNNTVLQGIYDEKLAQLSK